MYKHSIFKFIGFSIALTALFLGCQPKNNEHLQIPEKSVFEHGITSEKKPWTHENFDDQKFTFALFSDLSGGERKGVFEVAVQQLNLLRPDMIINIGDLIDGEYDSLPQLIEQWESFDKRANKAKAPIFYVGGNHDLGSEELWEIWDNRYGQRYYHFVYKNVLFLVLNSEDNTPERMQEIAKIRTRAIERVKKEGMGVFPQTEYAALHEQKSGNIGNEQAAYFRNVIQKNPDVLHTFLFVHKAPWKKKEQNFSSIEQALKDREYTVFNGHVHAYGYEERLGHDYIRLATTGGMQFPEKGRSADHITLVTVDKSGVNIANILMAGILDKKGNIPNGGDTLCFEKALCN